MEPSEIRKRVLQTLEQARRAAAAHRDATERATRAFETLLPLAAASWKVVFNVLRAEGLGFAVQTPAGMLRVAPDRSGDDLIEVVLDTARRPPAVMVRTRLTRGRRIIDRESIVAEGDDVLTLDEDRLLAVLLTELEPFVER